MSQIFKRVAIAAGAGLGVALSSVCVTPARRAACAAPEPEPEVPMPQGIPADDVLYLDPLFDRLEALERRAEQPAPAPVAVAPDFSEIRSEIDDLRRSLPDQIAAAVAAQPAPAVNGDEIRQIVADLVDTRLASLEETLASHSEAVGALQFRVAQTDANLQNLVNVITRLIEGPGLPTSPLAGQPVRGTHAAASFEAHLTEAMRQTPPEAPADPPRRRSPLSRIF